jgi:hypothetical protein
MMQLNQCCGSGSGRIRTFSSDQGPEKFQKTSIILFTISQQNAQLKFFFSNLIISLKALNYKILSYKKFTYHCNIINKVRVCCATLLRQWLIDCDR